MYTTKCEYTTTAGFFLNSAIHNSGQNNSQIFNQQTIYIALKIINKYEIIIFSSPL